MSSALHEWERLLRACRQQDGGRSQPIRGCNCGHFDGWIPRDRRILPILQSFEGVASPLPYSISQQIFAHLTSIQVLYVINAHSLLTLITYVTKVPELV